MATGQKIKMKNHDSFIEELAVIPPETQHLSKKFLVRIPATDRHFKSPWHLRLYALQLLEQQIGDEVQLTSMRVKKPRLLSKGTARLRGREPVARLYVTIEF